MSYRARYRALDPRRPLLGGVLSSTTSAFADYDDCARRLSAALDINRGAGRPCDGEVYETGDPPDIYRHECTPGRFARIATARGCRCPDCGAILR